MPRCLLAFEPPDGGVAENVMRLAVGLGSRGVDVTVAGPSASVIEPALRDAGVPLVRLPLRRGYGHPLDDARALRRLTALIRRQRFDVVHAHSAKAGVLGRLAARATGTPVVYSPHCFPFVGPWGAGRRLFAVGVERALGQVTDATLCVAEDERREALARRVGHPARLHVIHNGSPACESGVLPLDELAAFAEEGPVAACIAVLRPQKAVHVFVQAAPEILAQAPDARLAVVGNGELRDELEAQARDLGLDGRLRFFDFSPPMARPLASTSVFVLPSSWEAFPISILEALACGVPQVATRVGGTSEALEEGRTGLLCPPDDPHALAEAVATLLNSPERRHAMRTASVERHDRHFGLERMIDETAELYRTVVDRGRPKRPAEARFRTRASARSPNS